MKKILFLVVSHVLVGAVGFAIGIYALPILIAPPPPSPEELETHSQQAVYTGEFQRDLEGSDLLHWGEGRVSVGRQSIVFVGKLAPGPDYKLYLSPEFVETEAEFERLREHMVRVGDVRTFENFLVAVPESVDPARYNTVIVWCESFAQFITAARYR
ncbi:DM13 domain-containing protein [Halomonas sp. EGI 63088]|uniref:DM13 domain-containing protein n=1 Tax=Halomonas flagellata TaxID=2920385 RepID=A0ABS9RZ32_9GAMM|nr:DM13 domain-containing protein [Halomonas flagellata]MCH4565107.1 DM13 domain-containing protein [Halomonas flagellata]